MDKFYKVLTICGVADYYYYKSKLDIVVGAFVKVPFGGKNISGVVVDCSSSIDIPVAKVKEVIDVYKISPLKADMIKFIYWLASYTMSYPPLLLKMVISGSLDVSDKILAKIADKNKQEETYNGESLKNNVVEKENTYFDDADIENSIVKLDVIANEIPHSSSNKNKKIEYNYQKIELNSEQKYAAEVIKNNKDFNVFLLNGVTGSGKTEVYFNVLEDKLKNGGQVLILMPEIALGTNFVQRFETAFGVKPLEWHSDLTKKNKREVWHSIHNGKASVVIGARSALFLPFKNLQTIIVDEEHDNSYKQEDGVIYHARDMAVVRASIEKIPIILASATPSLESVINVNVGRYQELQLTKRYNNAIMPVLELIDMKKNKPLKIAKSQGFISQKLIEEIKTNLENKEQTLLFLNRKGFAPFVVCGACGYRYQCPNCSSWLVEHRKIGIMKCHQCDYYQNIDGKCCSCNKENTLISCGPGIERIEQEVLHYFPKAIVKTLSADNVSRKNALLEIKEIVNSESDIIIGTQILAKGYHFPNLTLVGVVDADMGLAGGDLRAMEKTYQLLNQVAGRAGREAKKGRVFLQTYSPEHLLMQALIKGSAEEFYSLEEKMRKDYKMPPFSQLASVVVSAIKPENALEVAKKIALTLAEVQDIAVLGPAQAVIFKINNRYRYRLLIKASKKLKIAECLKKNMEKIKISTAVRVKVDINPYNFL